jgi:hypothetical protein
VFLQYTVDQTDQFARKLSIYARGQIGKLDYRLVMSDPSNCLITHKTLFILLEKRLHNKNT